MDQTGKNIVKDRQTETQVQDWAAFLSLEKKEKKHKLCNIEAIIRRQSHSQNNTCLFLASLSVADLLFLLLYLPLDVWRQVDSSVYQVGQTWIYEQLMALWLL